MKISFLICTHNEGEKYLLPLFDQIGEFCKKTNDQFVILDDMSTDDSTISSISLAKDKYQAKVVNHQLYDGREYHFGRHKTIGSRACSGDWIFLIDGDEILSETLLENIHDFIELNPEVELMRVPRLNYIDGMTDSDVKQWGWRVSDILGKNYINFPDFQCRIYRNKLEIFWQNRLHEVIVGAKVIAEIPPEPDLSLIHVKTIDRQKNQNMFYNTNFSNKENMGHN
jgi:glycosyltransferase involved in cell wall biosynthesis